MYVCMCVCGGFPPNGPSKQSLKVIWVSNVPRRMLAKAIGLHQSEFWDQRFPSRVDLQPGGLRLWPALPSYTARNSVAPMANSARTRGTTRRCCHGHSNVVEATCSNPKPGMPDRATRLSLHLERIGQNAHHFPFVSGTFGPGLTTPPRIQRLRRRCSSALWSAKALQSTKGVMAIHCSLRCSPVVMRCRTTGTQHPWPREWDCPRATALPL